jgi:hypothetical protein
MAELLDHSRGIAASTAAEWVLIATRDGFEALRVPWQLRCLESQSVARAIRTVSLACGLRRYEAANLDCGHSH